MKNIIYDDKIITPENDRWNYYKNFTKKLNGRDCVKFSLFCAKIVNPNIKESNLCIALVEKWLVDENLVVLQELWDFAYSAYTVAYSAYTAAYTVANATYCTANAAANAAIFAVEADVDVNKYLQILLRKTKQFQNNKILEQISKVDVDKLELVDWNMITDIIQEEYNIVHEFEYSDIFSRRCLIELLRREYA